VIIPYGRQDITEADIAAVVSTLKGDFLTQGPTIDTFEDALGAYLGSKHTVAVANGTAGLHIAYLALGVGKGDAVIVPAVTFAATANAALYCGATPIFADIDPISGGISLESAERAIGLAKSKGLNPKVIAPVHFGGRPCDMGAVVTIARKYDLRIVEDACHAFGAEYRLSANASFQKVGSSEWTSMAVFSFHPVKHITTGEGGAVTTSDPKLATKLKALRSHGITKNSAEYLNKSRASANGLANPWYHEMQTLGLNYRLCDIQASLGQSQVSRATANIKRRREIAQMYDKAFQNFDFLKPAAGDSSTARHSYHLYPVQIDYEGLAISRAKFMNLLRELGVGSQVHYLPVFWHPYYENNRNLWLSDNCPNAEAFYARELSIPMYSTLSAEQQDLVIKAISNLVK
jgi:UDP-4-amino-4,6-dideoxy-N-acetyl-beta-L-altrosamine transaminase